MAGQMVVIDSGFYFPWWVVGCAQIRSPFPAPEPSGDYDHAWLHSGPIRMGSPRHATGNTGLA